MKVCWFDTQSISIFLNFLEEFRGPKCEKFLFLAGIVLLSTFSCKQRYAWNGGKYQSAASQDQEHVHHIWQIRHTLYDVIDANNKAYDADNDIQQRHGCSQQPLLW